MNLKEYRPQPDEGLFDQISGRLQRRRMVRVGASVAVAIVAIVAVGRQSDNIGNIQSDREPSRPPVSTFPSHCGTTC